MKIILAQLNHDIFPSFSLAFPLWNVAFQALQARGWTLWCGQARFDNISSEYWYQLADRAGSN